MKKRSLLLLTLLLAAGSAVHSMQKQDLAFFTHAIKTFVESEKEKFLKKISIEETNEAFNVKEQAQEIIGKANAVYPGFPSYKMGPIQEKLQKDLVEAKYGKQMIESIAEEQYSLIYSQMQIPADKKRQFIQNIYRMLLQNEGYLKKFIREREEV